MNFEALALEQGARYSIRRAGSDTLFEPTYDITKSLECGMGSYTSIILRKLGGNACTCLETEIEWPIAWFQQVPTYVKSQLLCVNHGKLFNISKKKKKTHLYTQITNLTINLMRKIYYYTREASIGCRVLIINSTGLTHGYYRTNVNLVLLPVHKSIVGKPNPKNLFIKHLSFSHQPLGS